MMISSALVNSTISAIETVFALSNFSHNLRFDTISTATLTLTCNKRLVCKNIKGPPFHAFGKFDLLGIFEARPLYWALLGSREASEPRAEDFAEQGASHPQLQL